MAEQQHPDVELAIVTMRFDAADDAETVLGKARAAARLALDQGRADAAQIVADARAQAVRIVDGAGAELERERSALHAEVRELRDAEKERIEETVQGRVAELERRFRNNDSVLKFLTVRMDEDAKAATRQKARYEREGRQGRAEEEARAGQGRASSCRWPRRIGRSNTRPRELPACRCDRTTRRPSPIPGSSGRPAPGITSGSRVPVGPRPRVL